MTININHDVRVVDGKTIYMPPWVGSQPHWGNLELPLVSVVNTVQKYPLGTRYVYGDRVYRYALANDDCYPEVAAYKKKKTNTNAVAPTQATDAGTVGSKTLTVTIDTEIGALTTGVLSINELAGGYIVIGNGSGQRPQMRIIVSHAALATAGGSLTITIDEPLVIAITESTTNIELMESPFYGLAAESGDEQYVSFIGIPACVAASGEYFWLQTWGPVWITSNGNTCNSAMDRTLVFKGNGSVVSSDDITIDSGFQVAGFALDMSGSASSNAPMVFLQIMP